MEYHTFSRIPIKVSILTQLRANGYGLLASSEMSMVLDKVLNRQHNGVTLGVRSMRINNFFTGQAYKCMTSSTHNYTVEEPGLGIMGYS